MTAPRTDTVQEIDALIDKAEKRYDQWFSLGDRAGMQSERDHVAALQDFRARIVGKTWLEASDFDHHDGYSQSHDEHPEPKPVGRPLIPFPVSILIVVIVGTLVGTELWHRFN